MNSSYSETRGPVLTLNFAKSNVIWNLKGSTIGVREWSISVKADVCWQLPTEPKVCKYVKLMHGSKGDWGRDDGWLIVQEVYMHMAGEDKWKETCEEFWHHLHVKGLRYTYVNRHCLHVCIYLSNPWRKAKESDRPNRKQSRRNIYVGYHRSTSMGFVVDKEIFQERKYGLARILLDGHMVSLETFTNLWKANIFWRVTTMPCWSAIGDPTCMKSRIDYSWSFVG